MSEEIFTPQEVANLHRHQFGPFAPIFGERTLPDGTVLYPRMHPFTCPNHGDERHFSGALLIPTVRGWICQCCDYQQGWAHEFMKGKRDD